MATDTEYTHRHSIVYIESEPNFIELVRLILQRSFGDVEVLRARDANTGLRLAANLKPDLILLDDMVPRVDSLEVLRRLKGSSRLRRIPVVLTTTNAEFEYLRRCLELGADDYVRVPFVARDLVEKISRLLGWPIVKAHHG